MFTKKIILIVLAVAALVATASVVLGQAGAPICTGSYARARGVVLDPTGTTATITHGRLICGTCTSLTQRCVKRRSTNEYGGVRQWCDCERTTGETTTCHLVMFTPGNGEGGGPTRLFCAGSCPGTAQCRLQVNGTGRVVGGEQLFDVRCICN